MNIEFEVKNILREKFTPEVKIRLIQVFTNFNKKDILNAINSNENINNVYSILVNRKIRRDRK